MINHTVDDNHVIGDYFLSSCRISQLQLLRITGRISRIDRTNRSNQPRRAVNRAIKSQLPSASGEDVHYCSWSRTIRGLATTDGTAGWLRLKDDTIFVTSRYRAIALVPPSSRRRAPVVTPFRPAGWWPRATCRSLVQPRINSGDDWRTRTTPGFSSVGWLPDGDHQPPRPSRPRFSPYRYANRAARSFPNTAK